MVDQVDSIESLKEEVGNDKIVDSINVLFLDISSSCTGYAIGNVNFTTKKVNFTKAGAIWLNPDWCHQEKYSYMYKAISNYFWVVESIDYILVEQYSVNPKKLMGVNVVSEMQGAIKAAGWENGVKVSSILPQSWRKILQIKRNSEGDYKDPTKNFILTVAKVPEESTSNITGQSRKTPSDVYDAMAIGMAWLIRLGFDKSKFSFTNTKYNTHVGYE